MVSYITGNILYAQTDAIAHGCNTKGRMHQGLANELRMKIPGLYREYRALCTQGEFVYGQGSVFLGNDPLIINLATQAEGKATVESVQSAFEWMREISPEYNINSIAMPRIGCGLGGLKWSTINNVLEDIFSASNIEIEVWSKQQSRLVHQTLF